MWCWTGRSGMQAISPAGTSVEANSSAILWLERFGRRLADFRCYRRDGVHLGQRRQTEHDAATLVKRSSRRRRGRSMSRSCRMMKSAPRIAVLTSAMMKVHSSGLRTPMLRVSLFRQRRNESCVRCLQHEGLLDEGLRKIFFGIIESTEPESTRKRMSFPRSMTLLERPRWPLPDPMDSRVIVVCCSSCSTELLQAPARPGSTATGIAPGE
ncbi:unnamed protein product [Trichogramma brassicae]|uniref:Uncharacterized protein n=1 Tax=Trichogramma brassicae TaxID=86971 RepID=A0A6H5J0I8_9HYME|nr:unnamed protein product [Trichogramma brassicae]